jgi:hypothetical protein
LPLCLISPTYPSPATVRTRRSATGPFCVSCCWSKAPSSSDPQIAWHRWLECVSRCPARQSGQGQPVGRVRAIPRGRRPAPTTPARALPTRSQAERAQSLVRPWATVPSSAVQRPPARRPPGTRAPASGPADNGRPPPPNAIWLRHFGGVLPRDVDVHSAQGRSMRNEPTSPTPAPRSAHPKQC